MSPFSERVEWALGAGWRVGRAAGDAAVASDAAPGPHRRRPRTEPFAHCPTRTCSKIEPQPTQSVWQGGPDTVLCTSDPYWTSVTTDRYLTASCKTPSDVDAGLPSCPLADQFSTCSTGIFDYCRDLFFLTIAQATYWIIMITSCAVTYRWTISLVNNCYLFDTLFPATCYWMCNVCLLQFDLINAFICFMR